MTQLTYVHYPESFFIKIVWELTTLTFLKGISKKINFPKNFRNWIRGSSPSRPFFAHFWPFLSIHEGIEGVNSEFFFLFNKLYLTYICNILNVVSCKIRFDPWKKRPKMTKIVIFCEKLLFLKFHCGLISHVFTL